MLHMKFIQDNIDDIKFKKKYQKVVSNIFVHYYIQNIQDKDKQNYQIIIDFLAQCLKIDFKNNSI